jgi:hypothetical protein
MQATKQTSLIMKNYIIVLILLAGFFLAGTEASAQRIGDLHGINYQAVAIDEEGKEIVGMDVTGKPLYEQEIDVRFTITKGQDGEVQYQETHTTLTDQYGLFSLVIGQGEQTGTGVYSDLLSMPWIDADQWLKVEISMSSGDYKTVSMQQLMSVPYSFYTDDIADDAITTEKILNEEIIAEDIQTGAVESDEILNETILAEDIGTGSVESDEILDETIIADDIAIGAVESTEILDETILHLDIAEGAVQTSEILDETILADDIGTGSVESDEILDETIAAIDIGTGAVESDEILDETIAAIDIGTGAVESDEILDETIAAIDIGTGAVESDEILDETIVAADIATSAVTSDEILDETIVAADIAAGAVTGDEILDGTIQNIDIADGTIDLSTKVTDTLAVEHGGTGAEFLTDGGILLGGGSGAIKALPQGADGEIPVGVTGADPVMTTITAGVGIVVDNEPGLIRISSGVEGVNSSSAGSVQVGKAGGPCPGERYIAAGETWISAAIPISGVELGNVVIGAINHSLQGCMMTTFVANQNVIKVAIFNGTGGDVCFPGGLELWVLIVK